MSFLVGFLLFLGACVGHTGWLVFSVNWVYGVRLPRKIQWVYRNLCGLLVAAGPFVFWAAAGWNQGPVVRWTPGEGWRAWITVYGWLCGGLGLGLFPIITLRRLWHRPAALLSNHTQTLDVAKELGFQPLGRGKHRLLARLPGNEVFRVDFTEKTFQIPGLPAAWEGLSILHLTDLHFQGTPDRTFYERVLDHCRAWEPDLVALTGDIVDSDYHHRWVVPILGRLRWRVAAFAILGNHDAWHEPELTRRRLRRLGMHVLGNTWEQLEVRGEPLVVIGHEGPWFRPEPDLTACPSGVFRLCLSHTPDNLPWARENGIQLMLAGHNHGGQIRVPLVGSILVPSRYSRRYDCGTFQEPPTVLHVSRGLGGQHPLRFNCRPEVTKITVTSNQRSAASHQLSTDCCGLTADC